MHYWFSVVALTHFNEHMLSSILGNFKWKSTSWGLYFPETSPRQILGEKKKEKRPLDNCTLRIEYLEEAFTFYFTFFIFTQPIFSIAPQGKETRSEGASKSGTAVLALVHSWPWQSSCKSTIHMYLGDSFYKSYPSWSSSSVPNFPLPPPFFFNVVSQLCVFLLN